MLNLMNKGLNVVWFVIKSAFKIVAIMAFIGLIGIGVIPEWVPYAAILVGFAAYLIKLWWNTHS
jgi:hypothetical protein